MRRVVLLALTSFGALASAPAAQARQLSSGDEAATCARLKTFRPDDTTVITAARLVTPSSRGTGQSPLATKAFCRIEGVSSPSPGSEITFEVWLPLRNAWNGRFQGIGGGGVSGQIRYESTAAGMSRGLRAAVEAGFAAVSTDNGHRLKSDFDQSWAIGQPEKVVDFGFRAIHLTTVIGKQITERYYGRQIAFSYWVGCSQGGGKGLMNAQRWPGDYNGILAGAPVAQWTRAMAGITAAALTQMRRPETIIPESKRAFVHAEVIRQCDKADGLEDGILSRPDKCAFDVKKIQCGFGDRPDCLTSEQAAALMASYAGARRSNGERLTDGYELGAEGAWPFLGQSTPGQVWGGFWGGMVFEDAGYDILKSLDLERGYDFASRKLGWSQDAQNPDLRPFYAAGGKLMVFHGEADQLITPRPTTEYYNQVRQVMGDEKVDEFFQYFLVPGMNHCRGGDGPNTFDLLPALQAWVEKGERPKDLVATNVVKNAVVRSRPLCRYPTVAKYRGAGDITRVESFVCAPRD